MKIYLALTIFNFLHEMQLQRCMTCGIMTLLIKNTRVFLHLSVCISFSLLRHREEDYGLLFQIPGKNSLQFSEMQICRAKMGVMRLQMNEVHSHTDESQSFKKQIVCPHSFEHEYQCHSKMKEKQSAHCRKASFTCHDIDFYLTGGWGRQKLCWWNTIFGILVCPQTPPLVPSWLLKKDYFNKKAGKT